MVVWGQERRSAVGHGESCFRRRLEPEEVYFFIWVIDISTTWLLSCKQVRVDVCRLLGCREKAHTAVGAAMAEEQMRSAACAPRPPAETARRNNAVTTAALQVLA